MQKQFMLLDIFFHEDTKRFQVKHNTVTAFQMPISVQIFVIGKCEICKGNIRKLLLMLMPSLSVEYCSNSCWSLIDDPWQQNSNMWRNICDKCTAFGTILDSSWNQLSIFDAVGHTSVKPPTGSFPFYQQYVGYVMPLPGDIF